MFELLILIAGCLLLLQAGGTLVSACIHLAQRLHIAPGVASATFVAIGTSLPEISVSLLAPADAIDVAVGNIIGSNIQNIAVVLGITLLLHPMRIDGASARRQWAFALGACLYAYGILQWPVTQPNSAGLLLTGFVFVLYHTLRIAKRQGKAQPPPDATLWSWGKCFFQLGLGLAGLVLGSEAVLHGAVHIATELRMPQHLVGFTLVALGTSLPELAFSLAALRHGHHAVALGNILGSNVYNVLLGLGIALWHTPAMHVPRIDTSEWVLLLGYSLLLLPAMRVSRPVPRWFGLLLVLPYAGYSGYLLWHH
ncbi:MAG: sodium:calcium antiporter [Myxococcota bacterium]